MVTFPDDYDPSAFDAHGQDEDARHPKLSDYKLEKRGPTIAVKLRGEYIMPSSAENIELVTKLVQALTKVKTVYIDGKMYKKIDNDPVIDPEVYISVDKVFLNDKVEVTKNTPIQDAIEAIVLQDEG